VGEHVPGCHSGRRIQLTTWPSCSYSISWCSSPRLGARSWCGLGGHGAARVRNEGLRCISPGAGTAGSLRLRFRRMLDLRRARSTSRRMLPEDWRRRSSFWMPAFMVAAAARECGGVCEGDCDMVRLSWSAGAARAWRGLAAGDGDEGGSEFRSGGMASTRCRDADAAGGTACAAQAVG
jgi:hypothetical protein